MGVGARGAAAAMVVVWVACAGPPESAADGAVPEREARAADAHAAERADAAPAERAALYGRSGTTAATHAIQRGIEHGIQRGDVTMGPPLAPDRILAVVRAHEPAIEACFAAAPRSRGASVDRVTVAWTITAGGRPREARVVSPPAPPPALSRCLRRAIEAWRFPRPLGGGEVRVRLPLHATAPP